MMLTNSSSIRKNLLIFCWALCDPFSMCLCASIKTSEVDYILLFYLFIYFVPVHSSLGCGKRIVVCQPFGIKKINIKNKKKRFSAIKKIIVSNSFISLLFTELIHVIIPSKLHLATYFNFSTATEISTGCRNIT